MNDYQELRDWIDWEGGYAGLIQHGVDLEEDIPEEIRQLWVEMTQAYEAFDVARQRVNEVVGY